MVLKSNKFIIILFLFISFLNGCEDLYIVICDDCQLTEPTTCNLEIILNESPGNVYEITIYRGTLDEGIIVFNGISSSSFDIEVGLNSDYTVTASIIINNKEYTAVDSTRPRVDEVTDVCDETCYWIRNNKVNLKMKYY